MTKISSDSSNSKKAVFMSSTRAMSTTRSTEEGTFLVTRLNENANYEVISKLRQDAEDFLYAGTALDQIVTLKANGKPLKARLITYKDPLTGKIFRFVNNLLELQSRTIVLIYKNRWEIAPFFKKIKQSRLPSG